MRRGRYAVYTTEGAHDDNVVVFDGNNCIYMREHTTNSLEITHFENGQGVLVSEMLLDNKTIKRTYTTHKLDGELLRSYLDYQNNGVWDLMLNFGNFSISF